MSKSGYSPTIATWLRWPKSTDHFSSEEYRCTHSDTCLERTWITYGCEPRYLWCTHRTSLGVKKPFQFSCGYEQFHEARSSGFLVMNVCNHWEHYETPVYLILNLQTCHLFNYVHNFTRFPSLKFRFICTKNCCVLLAYTTIFYWIPFRISAFFSDRRNLAIGKDSISGKIYLGSFVINLRFVVSLFDHSFRYKNVTVQVNPSAKEHI
jgi:hypothetical protein